MIAYKNSWTWWKFFSKLLYLVSDKGNTTMLCNQYCYYIYRMYEMRNITTLLLWVKYIQGLGKLHATDKLTVVKPLHNDIITHLIVHSQTKLLWSSNWSFQTLLHHFPYGELMTSRSQDTILTPAWLLHTLKDIHHLLVLLL